MNRRYDPNVPVDISYEEEVLTNKIGVKVMKRPNSESEGEDDEVVDFRIETDIPLLWVMFGYCEKLGLDFQTTRFEFNCAKLRETDTPCQLSMVDKDVIFAFPSQGGSGDSTAHYATLCIRVHKETDRFLRVRRSTAILPQLMRCFPSSGPQDQGSAWFVYGGLKLAQNHTANQLNMEDGDIIDGFNFKTMRSSLSMIRPCITIKVFCQSGNVTQFRVTQNTIVGQVMDRLYPQDQDSNPRYPFRFISRGRRLDPTQTVEEVQLEDGDVIHSMLCLKGC